MKRVFIVHGWGGHPGEGWFPRTADALRKEGFRTRILKMPDTHHPRIRQWVSHLRRSVGTPDSDTYLIGHSIGCQTILRYLQTSKPIGGAVLVAGWFSIRNSDDSEADKRIARPWLNTPIDSMKVRRAAKRITVVLSSDDPVVPLRPNATAYRQKLGAKIIIQKKKGHFAGDDGIREIPVVVREIVRMSNG